MPLGSSSATPVMRPGPSRDSGCRFRRPQNNRIAFAREGLLPALSDNFAGFLLQEETGRQELPLKWPAIDTRSSWRRITKRHRIGTSRRGCAGQARAASESAPSIFYPGARGPMSRDQSTLTLAALIIGHHFAVSASGQAPIACCRDRGRTDGSLIVVELAPLCLVSGIWRT
jgi:hypothetical protein